MGPAGYWKPGGRGGNTTPGGSCEIGALGGTGSIEAIEEREGFAKASGGRRPAAPGGSGGSTIPGGSTKFGGSGGTKMPGGTIPGGTAAGAWPGAWTDANETCTPGGGGTGSTQK